MTRLDDCLSMREGRLHVEGCAAADLVRRFGSPLFVLSEDQVRRNVRRFQASFQAGWPDGPVAVLPAAKANWHPAVLRILADAGCGCDVYSPGELAVALEAGIEPGLISVNGVAKDEAHIHRCVEAGVRITIDTVEEVDAIERAARSAGRPAQVRLRLKPALASFSRRSGFVAEGLVPTDLASLLYKGGLPFEAACAIGGRLLRRDDVQLVGFHQHHGRHDTSMRYWAEQMRAFAAEIGRVCRALGGFRPREIDIGGGFPIPRDPFNAATRYDDPYRLAVLYAASQGARALGREARYRFLARLVGGAAARGAPPPAPAIEAYAAVCTRTLREALPREGIPLDGLMLQLEPGRAAFGDAGVHLTTVVNVKRQREPVPWTWVVVDTTEFWFTEGRFEHTRHAVVFDGKEEAPRVETADLVGRSCFTDRLVPAVRVPDLRAGDLVALLDTGAYQDASMSNFNALPRPAVALVRGGEAELIRRRETGEDLFRFDAVPERLRRAARSNRPG
jgi:diaminopimelate decarboxylase